MLRVRPTCDGLQYPEMIGPSSALEGIQDGIQKPAKHLNVFVTQSVMAIAMSGIAKLADVAQRKDMSFQVTIAKDPQELAELYESYSDGLQESTGKKANALTVAPGVFAAENSAENHVALAGVLPNPATALTIVNPCCNYSFVAALGDPCVKQCQGKGESTIQRGI